MTNEENQPLVDNKSEVIEHLLDQLDEMVIYLEDREVEEPDFVIVRRLIEELRDEVESLVEE